MREKITKETHGHTHVLGEMEGGRSRKTAALLSSETKMSKKTALDSLLGPGTCFQRPGILLRELDLCHEKWGEGAASPFAEEHQ